MFWDPLKLEVSKAYLKGLKIKYPLEHIPTLGDFSAGENLEDLLMMQLLMEKWANGSLGGRRAEAVQLGNALGALEWE